MLHLLRRHPWAVEAHLEWSLAMVFAIPREVAKPLLSPGLQLDTYGDHAFIAAAFVRTLRQRPTWMPPFMADDFYLAGWRVFVRAQLPDGRNVRGLKILRSDTDSRRLVLGGGLLTNYHFRQVKVTCQRDEESLHFSSSDMQGHVEVDFIAHLTPSESLPPNSPFPDLRIARQFAGPMPFTFSYEEQSDSLIVVKGSRQHWQPIPIQVEPRRLQFFEQPPFSHGGLPRLANAFWVQHVDYRWEPGQRIPAHLTTPTS